MQFPFSDPTILGIPLFQTDFSCASGFCKSVVVIGTLQELSPAGCLLQGMLRGQELREAYASADIFMMPSESETLGFVVLEVRAAAFCASSICQNRQHHLHLAPAIDCPL